MPTVFTQRPRYRRALPRRIELTERDIDILRLLDRYRYMRSTFIHAFVGGNHRNFKDRLRDLYDHGFIDRPHQQRRAENARYSPLIHELADRGAAVLRERGIAKGTVSDLVARGRMGANRQFPHAMMICDVLASIELGVRVDPGVRLITWQEILERAPEETRAARNPFEIPAGDIEYVGRKAEKVKLVPDGLFGLEYQKPGGAAAYRFFAIEAERTNPVWLRNLQKTSFLKKVLAYRRIRERKIYTAHLGLPNLMVLVFAPRPDTIESMRALLLQVTDGRGSEMFCFRHIPVIGTAWKTPPPTPDLYTAPYQRAGKPDFWVNML